MITNIGLDHQQWLGTTFEQIAAEKAGIIKTGVPVITGAEPGRGLEVIVRAAEKNSAPLTVVQRVDAETGLLATIPLPLPGEHQRRNAAVALATVQALQSPFPVSQEVIARGLAQVQWPGRLQRIVTPDGRNILLDGAHNTDGAGALRAALESESGNRHPTLILGILADKDWESVVHQLAPMAGKIHTVPVDSPRTLPSEILGDACRRATPNTPVDCHPSLAVALAATAGDPLVVITGSLYLVGEALTFLHHSPEALSDERHLNDWSGIPPTQ